MGYTIEQIAAALGTTAVGAADIEVEGAAEPADATERQLALAMKPEFAEKLGQGKARAAVLWADADWQGFGLEAAILAPRPRFAMAGLTAMLDPGQGWEAGVHPSAIVHETAELGADVSIGPLAIVGAGAKIGEGTVIGPQCYVGGEAEIGPGGFLREGVRIGPRVRIGARFICQPGTVIGGDGFSYVTPEPSGVEKARKTLGDQGEAQAQTWARIHSLGSVEIGDDVEVGSNTTIDRGTIRSTRIGNGTKIDNLVMIGHNCEIGNDCLLCGHSGLAGSVRLGNNVVLGGQAGVSDNTFVGDNVIAGGASVILSNVPAGRVVLGYPAMKMDSTLELFRNFRRLKRLFADVDALKKTVSKTPSTD
ncbi:MAG: UDP-3-O-(3-hydroxymyristoyl)glucosamine N-acyltransferase [Roseovarius sp.]